MTDPVEAIEAAAGAVVSPSTIWLKVAGIAILTIGLVGTGWWLHGAFDGTKVAKAETAVAQSRAACETARANSNGKTATTLANDGKAAVQADAHTNAREEARRGGYAAAQQEASNVPVNPKPPICIDPEPLRQLFIGLRDKDAAAARADSDGGTSSLAQHELPAAAVAH